MVNVRPDQRRSLDHAVSVQWFGATRCHGCTPSRVLTDGSKDRFLERRGSRMSVRARRPTTGHSVRVTWGRRSRRSEDWSYDLQSWKWVAPMAIFMTVLTLVAVA